MSRRNKRNTASNSKKTNQQDSKTSDKVTTNPPPSQSTASNNPFSRLLKNIQLYLILTAPALTVIFVGLYVGGKLPPQLPLFVSIMWNLILLTGSHWNDIKSYISEKWKASDHMIVLPASGGTVILLLFVLVFIYPGLNLFVLTKPVSISKPILPYTTWKTILGPLVPLCDEAPKGTSWRFSGMTPSCKEAKLAMQASGTAPTDFDVDQINDNSYSQTNFSIQVDITFSNPLNTVTWAGLYIEVSRASGISYVLALSSSGIWQLQPGVNGGKIVPFDKGNRVRINPTQPITITMVVQYGAIASYINGGLVNWYGIGSISNPLVGMRVEQIGVGKQSSVLFSNFEISIPGGTS